jgi:hypothetical protein
MPVFKTAMETPSAALVSSILTHSRHPARAVLRGVGRRWAFFAGLALLLQPVPAAGQDPVAVAPATPPADSLIQPISPMGAFWRSFLLPGWGQARLNRKLTGGIFVAWEGVTLGMSLKTRHELGYLRRTGSVRADNKRREHEDWIVLLVFNHLFSGLEAYVSAHLADFPGDLRLEAVPGGVGGSVSVPIRIR